MKVTSGSCLLHFREKCRFRITYFGSKILDSTPRDLYLDCLVGGGRMMATSAAWADDLMDTYRLSISHLNLGDATDAESARWRFLVQKNVGGKGSSAVVRFLLKLGNPYL